MTWVAVGMAALGVVQGSKNEQKQIKDMEYKAELMKYAPYSSMASNIAQQAGPGGEGPLGSGLQGAANGIGVNGALQKQGAAKDAAAKEAAAKEAASPQQAPLAIPGQGMGADGKPLSLEEQQKYNLLAQQQAGQLNA